MDIQPINYVKMDIQPISLLLSNTTHQSAIINKQPTSLLLSTNNPSVCYYQQTTHQSAKKLSIYNRTVYYNPYTTDQTIVIATSVDIFHIPSFHFCYV